MSQLSEIWALLAIPVFRRSPVNFHFTDCFIYPYRLCDSFQCRLRSRLIIAMNKKLKWKTYGLFLFYLRPSKITDLVFINCIRFFFFFCSQRAAWLCMAGTATLDSLHRGEYHVFKLLLKRILRHEVKHLVYPRLARLWAFVNQTDWNLFICQRSCRMFIFCLKM